jgi:hypothetical protein
MTEITIPIKFCISRDEWAAIRAQFLVFGCPSKAVPKKYDTLVYRLASLYGNAQEVDSGGSYRVIMPHHFTRHLGWMAQWVYESNLAIAHRHAPSRYIIVRRALP